MIDWMVVLMILVNGNLFECVVVFDIFYNCYCGNVLVIDKWFLM